MGNLILNQRQISQRIRRMAYQIYEENRDESEIVLIGILSSGYKLTERIKDVLEEISPFAITIGELKVEKKDPIQTVESSLRPEEYSQKVVILIDDVLNSGGTLIYGVKHLLETRLKKLQTLVLVDRSHKKFPIKADFRGIYLSTSLSERVEVSFGEKDKVELF